MTNKEALDNVREHLTKLHANPDIYEDGTCTIICTLEEHIIPLLNYHIAMDNVIKEALNLPEEVWSRVNAVSPNDLRATGLTYSHTGCPIAKVKNVDLENGIIELEKINL